MKSKAQQFRQNTRSNSQGARVTPPHLDRKKDKSTPPVEMMHFASSAFLNSPDPSKLPVPDFDDDEMGMLESEMSTRLTVSDVSPVKMVTVLSPVSVGGKTDTLKQFLNIRPVSN